jgi:hypothetical protein
MREIGRHRGRKLAVDTGDFRTREEGVRDASVTSISGDVTEMEPGGISPARRARPSSGMKFLRQLAICLLVFFQSHLPAEEKPPVVPLPEALVQAGCSIMAKVIDTAGLREKLQQAGPFTCFAPTDEAFGALPEADLKKFLDPSRREELARWAGYLIVAEDVTEQDLLRSRRIPTLSGDFLTVWVSKGQIKLDRKATLVRKELPASNGVIHTLDSLLDPPSPEEKDRGR